MAKLKVVKLACNEQNDDTSDDELYVVVFIGRNPVSGAGSVVTSHTWDNVSTGEVRNLDEVIDPKYDPSDLYLVALMEYDDGVDITAPERANIKTLMRPMFQAFGASGSASLSSLAKNLMPEMATAINNTTTNDDLIDVMWLKPLESAGSWRGLHFVGNSANYWVRFKRQ
jgi:hypothetical protein